MKVALGVDHRGFTIKDELIAMLEEAGHQVVDLGTDSDTSVDYPDFAASVGRAVADGAADRGVIVCGSGVGASIAANKIPGVGIVGLSVISELLHAFLSASFDSREPRYVRRLSKVKAIEDEAAR